MAGTEEEILRRQGRRHVSVDPRGSVDAEGFFPSCPISIHDGFVRLSHILADEEFGVGKPRNDVALSIGDQDRGCRRQSAFLEVIGELCQIETGEHDPSDAAVAVLEAFGEMDHPLTVDRIDPIISNREPWLRHGTDKKRLISDR